MLIFRRLGDASAEESRLYELLSIRQPERGACILVLYENT